MDDLILLGDASKIRIVNLLFHEELCVCELELITGLSQSNISNHLKKLKEKKIISQRKNQKFNYNYISQDFENSLLLKYIISLEDDILLEDINTLKKVRTKYQICEISNNNLKVIKKELNIS